MEGSRLLDVPITESEHRRLSDTTRLLTPTPENTSTNSHPHHDDGGSDRSTSLQESVYQVNNPGYVQNQHVVHQRIPSSFNEAPPRALNLDQPTSYDRETTYAPLRYPPDLWKPFWTRKSTLGVLGFIFLLIVIASVLLWHFSHSSNGFDVDSGVSYYAWRYAPVAVLVVIVSLWKQVDYYFKLLAPWDELRRGPVPASRSLLLDYISPINIMSLLRAFKRGYIPIILSSTIFFLLTVITIFSAALLVPGSVIVASNTTVAIVTKTFDASRVNQSAFPNIAPFSTDPVYSTLGNVAYNLPYAPGVTSQYAYIPIGLDPDTDAYRHNATYAAQTDVFFPNLACTPLQVGVVGNAIVRANRTNATSTNNYITLQLPGGSICRNWTFPRVYAMNPQAERTPSRQLEGTMQRVYCAGAQGPSRNMTEPAGLLFTLTDIRYNQTIFPNGTITNSTRNLTAVSNVLCVPSYYMLKADVNNNSAALGADAVNLRVSSVDNMTLEGLSGANLAVLFEGVMNVSRGIFSTRQDNPQALAIPGTPFNLMALVSNRTSIQSFLDPKVMGTAAEATFRRVMSHYAAQTFTRPTQDEFFASSTYTQEKLYVSLVPFCVILACAAISALCTAVLWLLTPGPLLPRDPSLIATSATILARSPELNRLLRRQMSSKTAMTHALNDYYFGSAIATTESGDNSFKIFVSEATSRLILQRKRRMHQWWSPNALLVPAFGLAISIPAVLIGVLEYLQRRSDKNQGLATASNQDYATLGMVCVPALVLLLVAATIQYLDFHVQLISPWNKLATGNANPKRSLLSQLLGKLPPIAFVEAVYGGHVGAIFSVLAAIVASVFAIVGSGLYYIEGTTQSGSSREMVATDTFRIQNPYSVLNDNGAAGVLKLIDQQGAVYPDGTFDDLVFPMYTRQQGYYNALDLFNITTDSSVATVPALRPRLRCDILPGNGVNVTYVPASRTYNSPHYQIDSVYDLPLGCQYGGSHRNASFARFRNQFNTTTNSTTLYGGQLLDLVFGQNAASVNNYGELMPAIVGNNPATGCPSLAFTFARLLGNTQDFDVTSMVCYQQVQQLAANVTYQTNSSKLDHRNPPVVVDSVVTMLANPSSPENTNSFDWRIQRNLEVQLFGLNGTRLRSPNPSAQYHFDAFFSYLFNDTSNRDPASLVGLSNQDGLVNAINSLYGRYMAQVLNGNMRVPLNIAATAPNDPTVNRQVFRPTISIETSTTQPRVKQDKTSKLALQILLGISILFSILAYLLTNFHCLLPSNPCTIAGTMVLVAGSDLCYTPDDNLCDCCGKPRRSSWNHEDETEESIHAEPVEYHIPSTSSTTSTPVSRPQFIPDGAEWMDYRKFAKVFTNNRFSLGWWREDRTKARRRRFGVDIGSKPDGETDDDWQLGGRRRVGNQGLESFVMKGRDMLGDHRGQYHRAHAGDHASGGGGGVFSHGAISDPDVERGRMYTQPHMHEYGHGPGQEYEMGEPSPPGIRSPRRVRFEDEA